MVSQTSISTIQNESDDARGDDDMISSISINCINIGQSFNLSADADNVRRLGKIYIRAYSVIKTYQESRSRMRKNYHRTIVQENVPK